MGLVSVMIGLAVAQQATSLVIPRLIANAVDAYSTNTFVVSNTVTVFLSVAIASLVFGLLAALAQTVVGERVARDLRRAVVEAISHQPFMFVQNTSPSVLLTNVSSDVEAVKQYVSQAAVIMITSVFIIFGAAAMLLSINVKLGLSVLVMIPLIGASMVVLFSRVRPLFMRGQGVIDTLNRVINESILGASLIRVLNTQKEEFTRFLGANEEAKDVGMQTLRVFAAMIPIIVLIANAATMIMVGLGGRYVIEGTLSIGELAAFMSYLMILIFPMFMLGFMSNMVARAGASYARIERVLQATADAVGVQRAETFTGALDVQHVSLAYDQKPVLKDATFQIRPGSKTAIIGPTAAGKTQLLYVLAGLTKPNAGSITYDGISLADYDPTALRKRIGIVFQESAVFNMSLRENIAFSKEATEEDVQRAIRTAALSEFIEQLPDGVQTMVSERGTTLSGGQKQRVMLARALASNPSFLYLDDFTARVDAQTEQTILQNLTEQYPGLTLVSVTQKVATAQAYDHIILLMEGEVLAQGTHEELMKTSPEYVQIVESQRSTNTYELHTDKS